MTLIQVKSMEPDLDTGAYDEEKVEYQIKKVLDFSEGFTKSFFNPTLFGVEINVGSTLIGVDTDDLDPSFDPENGDRAILNNQEYRVDNVTNFPEKGLVMIVLMRHEI